MNFYEVIVGNVGCVCKTNNLVKANKAYNAYKRMSQINYGRAGNEVVMLFMNGDIKFEYVPEVGCIS